MQHYRCLHCGKQFQSKKREQRKIKSLWRQYVWERRTTKQLARIFKKSVGWVREKLDEAKIKIKKVKPQSVVIVADATYLKRGFGVCVFRSPHLKRNLYWKTCLTETNYLYAFCRYQLERRGFKIQAVVIDGKSSIRKVFSDLPTQICHFHQAKIITRYLTTRPKLVASQELKEIVQTLKNTNERDFSFCLKQWHEKWKEFLKEKTFNPETKRYFYTHKRLRSAYRSLITNLPYLFTCQKYPQLKIPNTTNSLDGSFAHFKEKLKTHRGLKLKRKLKVFTELLSK